MSGKAAVEEAQVPEECGSCGETPEHECSKSKRPCGHHCNHVWEQDICHWCGTEFGEETVELAWTRQDHEARADRLRPLADHLRVGHDVDPDRRRYRDTWLHIALLADEWFEDRAAHVEREAVAGVTEVGRRLREVFGPVCAEPCPHVGCQAQHIAADVLAALPQTGDAAAACVVPCDADCEAACHMVHQPEHKREVRVIADDPVQRAASWRHVRAAWLAGQLAGRRAALGADQ